MPEKTIRPEQFAKSGLSMAGELPLSAFELDNGLEFDERSSVHYELEGGVAPRTHILYIKGNLATKLQGVCQRCMEKCEINVQAEFLLGIVKSEKAAEALSSEYEPLIIEDKDVKLTSILEEELILCMPIVVMHQLDECSIKQTDWHYGDKLTKTAETKSENPFAKLASLKSKK